MTKPSLTPEQVEEARQAYAGGNYSATTLASRYHVSIRVMYRTLEGIHRPKPSQRDGHAWSATGRR